MCPIRRLSQVLRRRRLARGTTGKTEARYPWARSIEESSGLAAAETYPCKGNRQCREHRAGGRPWGHDSTPRPLPRSLGGEQESLAKFLPEDPTCLLGIPTAVSFPTHHMRFHSIKETYSCIDPFLSGAQDPLTGPSSKHPLMCLVIQSFTHHLNQSFTCSLTHSFTHKSLRCRPWGRTILAHVVLTVQWENTLILIKS